MSVVAVPSELQSFTLAALAGTLIAGVLWVVVKGRVSREVTCAGEPPRLLVAAASVGVALECMPAVRLAEDVNLGDGVLVLTGLAGVLVPGLTRRVRQALPAWFKASLALLLLSGGISLTRRWESANAVGLVSTVGAMALAPIVITMVATSVRRIEAVAAGFTLGASLSATAAVGQVIGLFDPTAMLGVPTFAGRATGLASHPNHLGMVSVFALPIALGLSKRQGGSWQSRGWWVAGAVLLAGILSSGSRAALVGGALATVPTAWASVKRWVKHPAAGVWIGVTATTAVAVLAVGASVSGPGSFLASLVVEPLSVVMQRSSDETGLAQSDLGRLEYYRSGLASVEDYWVIGRGYEAVAREHNLFLQMLLSGGVLGLAGLALMLTGALSSRKRGRQDLHLPVFDGARLSFLLWPVMGLFQNMVRDRYLFVPLGILFAFLALGSGRRATNSSELAAKIPLASADGGGRGL